MGRSKSRVQITPISMEYPSTLQRKQDVPHEICLKYNENPGFFFGMQPDYAYTRYVGMLQGTEGNILVVGGNGGGKSAGIAKPTTRTWTGTMCVTDIKGELSDWYAGLEQRGLVSREGIIFDPTKADSPGYDPFWWLLRDDAGNLLNNVREIAMAIAPVSPDDKQPFWAETEQSILAAALLYYFRLGLSFSETMCMILSSTMSKLCENLSQHGDVCVRMLLGEISAMKPETLAGLDCGLRSKIALFATDPYISHAFRGQREGANCFNWDDLDYCNIFLRIPADKIEQWSGAVNLMYTQLIRHLERRPDMYSAEGVHNVQTLLLMDEFARFGKLEMITSALATLRSKNVNICLMIQSVAQLDKIYGEDDRRIIFDNCQYQAILRANDADTQRYLCDLIGTHISVQRSMSEHIDECWDTSGYSRQISEIRDLIVQPHELSTLDDVLLRTPYGFSRVKKFRLYDEEIKSMLLADSEVIRIEVAAVAPPEASGLPPIRCTATPIVKTIADNTKNNEGAKIMSIEERTANANRRIDTAERKRRQEERVAQEEQKRKDSRRSYIIGDLVAKYFPQVTTFEPGISAEGQAQFEPLEAFLYVLSTDHDLVEEFRKRAAQLTLDDPDGEWRISS